MINAGEAPTENLGSQSRLQNEKLSKTDPTPTRVQSLDNYCVYSIYSLRAIYHIILSTSL